MSIGILLLLYILSTFLSQHVPSVATFLHAVPSGPGVSRLISFVYNYSATDTSFVVFDIPPQCDGRRLGNQLFMIAALLYVAQRTGRQAIVADVRWNCLEDFDKFFEETPAPTLSSSWTALGGHDQYLQRTLPQSLKNRPFSRSTLLQTILCPCFRFSERFPMDYDDRLVSTVTSAAARSKQTIILRGYFQSWRYASPVADVLRRTLTFKPEVRQVASQFLDREAPRYGVEMTSSGAVEPESASLRVGIHARRGDMLTAYHISVGYEPPGSTFYQNAMKYMVERYRKRKLYFIVCSDDVEWAKQNIVFKCSVGGMFQNFTPCVIHREVRGGKERNCGIAP